MDEVIVLRQYGVSWQKIADYYGLPVYELRKCFDQYLKEEYDPFQ